MLQAGGNWGYVVVSGNAIFHRSNRIIWLFKLCACITLKKNLKLNQKEKSNDDTKVRRPCWVQSWGKEAIRE